MSSRRDDPRRSIAGVGTSAAGSGTAAIAAAAVAAAAAANTPTTVPAAEGMAEVIVPASASTNSGAGSGSTTSALTATFSALGSFWGAGNSSTSTAAAGKDVALMPMSTAAITTHESAAVKAGGQGRIALASGADPLSMGGSGSAASHPFTSRPGSATAPQAIPGTSSSTATTPQGANPQPAMGRGGMLSPTTPLPMTKIAASPEQLESDAILAAAARALSPPRSHKVMQGPLTQTMTALSSSPQTRTHPAFASGSNAGGGGAVPGTQSGDAAAPGSGSGSGSGTGGSGAGQVVAAAMPAGVAPEAVTSLLPECVVSGNRSFA